MFEITDAWIPLADGTRLSARIWLPTGAGPKSRVSAILEYLPYRKDDGTAAEDAGRHPYFAAHGFAGVRVDLRGTGDSDGVCRGEYLQQEFDDALEVLAWLEQQEWCTGSVGMIGYSWGGINSLQIAALRPPQLRAVVTLYSTDDRYATDCHYSGGCLLASDMLKWASWMLAFNARPPDPLVVGPEWRQAWLDRLEQTSPCIEDWLEHQRRDEFWKHGSVAEDYSAIQVPVLAVGGWADAYTDAVPRLLENLSGPRRGIIGPWAHVFPHGGVPGPAIGFLQECVRWFDHWLSGAQTGVMDEPLLRVWMQDSLAPADFHAERPGRWVAEHSWPPSSVEPTRLKLLAGGPIGRLTWEDAPDTIQGSDEPAPSVAADQTCGATAGVWCANGMADELAIDQNADDERSICFETPVLQESLELLGAPLAQLTVSVDQPLALVAVRLCDIAPDGSSALLSWGVLNLSHRERHESPRPLEPGRRYCVTVPLKSIGERVLAGHRLRLAVSPTYWPGVWPSPIPVRLSVHLDESSSLLLPIRMPVAEPHEAPIAFGAPEASGPLVGKITESASRTRERSRNTFTGAAEIDDRQEYRALIWATQTDYAHAGLDHWSITPGDPLSARVECRRTVTIDRVGWNARVESTSVMTADTRLFHVANELSAFDGAERIFQRTWSAEIARDGV